MILEFFRKAVSIIETFRQQAPSANKHTDISFNMISQKCQDLRFEQDEYVFVCVEIFLEWQNQELLVEAWTFSLQNHEQRKDLNIIQNTEQVQLKLCNLLKTISCLLINLPVFKLSQHTSTKISLKRHTEHKHIETFSQKTKSFPYQEEYSLFYLDKKIKKITFKLDYIEDLSSLFEQQRKISQESQFQLAKFIDKDSQPESSNEFSLREYDLSDEPYFEGAFVKLQPDVSIRKLSNECSQRYDSCEFLQNSQDELVSDFMGELKTMKNVKRPQNNLQDLIQDIQSFYQRMQ